MSLHRRQSDPNHPRRRYWGMLALVGLVLALVAGVVTISAGIHPINNESFDHVDRKEYQHAHNPIVLALAGQPANSTQANALPATPAVRAIVIEPRQISLLAAGKTIQKIPYGGSALDLAQVMNLVNDDAMIEETSSGRITLKVALITRKVSLTIGSPLVSEVRMVDAPSVFIGADGGYLDFEQVTIRSVSSDDPSANWYQPFVMATNDATMNTDGSTFTGLGWDSNASYGVSWVEGATGNVTGSTFEDSFIGVYTSKAVGMTFRNSTFRDNALYGLDPHTHSRDLTIENVVAEGNRAHGIIFSDHVTESIIKNSISRNNGENGIMMDEFSTSNWIMNNQVYGNTGDGFVTAASGHNVLQDNTIRDNRVGIRLDTDNTATTTVEANQILSNGVAVEGVALNSTNTSRHNGGQWNWPVVQMTWILAGAALMLLAIALGSASRRQQRRQRPRLQAV